VSYILKLHCVALQTELLTEVVLVKLITLYVHIVANVLPLWRIKMNTKWAGQSPT